MFAMRLPLRRVSLFAFTHAVVTLCLLGYAFGQGMVEFDNPDLPRSVAAETTAKVAGVLMLPGRLVWTAWASKNLSDAFEWVVFLANSVVWSVLIVGATAILPGWSTMKVVR